MSRTISLNHELEEFDEEESKVDPLIMSAFTIALLSVIGIPVVLALKLFFR